MSYFKFKKINHLINKKVWFHLIILLTMTLLLALLETLSIATIPALLGFILEPDSLAENYRIIFKYETIENFLSILKVEYFILIVFIVFFLKNFYASIFFYVKGLIVRRFISNTTQEIFKKYLSLPLVDFQKYNFSFITNIVSTQTSLSFNFLDSFVILIKEVIILLFLIFFAYLVEPVFVLFVLGILTLFSALYFILIKKILRNIGEETIKFKSLFYKYLNETLNLFKDIKILSNENYFINKFSKSTHGLHKTNHIRGFLVSLPKPILETVAILALLLFTLYLIRNYESKDDIITTLTLLVVISIRFLPAINLITSSASMMKSTYPSIKLLLDEKYKLDQLSSNHYENINCHEDFNNQNLIELKDVNFSFNDKKNLTLKNINISIKKNSFIAIVGGTGSGKSTLINLMLGLYHPKSGKVTYNLKEVRENIGYVPQHIYLSDDTIANNITLGEKNPDIDLLMSAINKAELAEFVNSKKDKLNTIVGEKGTLLSGGEIQRIGIARALYRNPKVLFFDEATSSLDVNTEEKIINTLSKINNLTKIFITHRTWKMSFFDKIFVVENSEVILKKN